MTLKKTVFLTVGTIDYLTQALVTLQSARESSSYDGFHFFVVDATIETVFSLRAHLGREFDWVKIFGPHDINSNKNLFLKAFNYFNPLELSCLAKYLGVEYVLESDTTVDICVYSDADILFTSDPSSYLESMTEGSILLTPHQFGPSTDVAEQEYLRYGWINAGFFAVKKGVKLQEILSWLINRIARRGFLAPTIGLFVDQVWLSLLPAFFSENVLICRHKGFNVAYWNLHERNLRMILQDIYIESDKLIFFHFSGFIGAPTNRLSKHSQVLVSNGSPLAYLCDLYKSKLEVIKIQVENFQHCNKLSACNGSLEKRLLLGSLENGLFLQSTLSGKGIFYRLGLKLDLLMNKIFN